VLKFAALLNLSAAVMIVTVTYCGKCQTRSGTPAYVYGSLLSAAIQITALTLSISFRRNPQRISGRWTFNASPLLLLIYQPTIVLTTCMHSNFEICR
jgi:hypothetical protein